MALVQVVARHHRHSAARRVRSSDERRISSASCSERRRCALAVSIAFSATTYPRKPPPWPPERPLCTKMTGERGGGLRHGGALAAIHCRRAAAIILRVMGGVAALHPEEVCVNILDPHGSWRKRFFALGKTFDHHASDKAGDAWRSIVCRPAWKQRMESLLVSTGVVAPAEIGDKTQPRLHPRSALQENLCRSSSASWLRPS